MVQSPFFIVLATLFWSGFGLECQLPPSSTIFDNSTVYIPGPTGDLQPIPPNFNCIYRIQAPVNGTHGFYVNLQIKNGMKGVNDIFKVTEIDGQVYTYNNRSCSDCYNYNLFPGAVMFVQVITKSVNMGSTFSMTLQYHSNDIGPTVPMKTGGAMNFIDLSTLRDGKNYFNTITYTNSGPIYITFAQTDTVSLCSNCYVLDGTIQNYTTIWPLPEYQDDSLKPTSNTVTLITASKQFWGVVLNNLYDLEKFDLPMVSTGVPSGAGIQPGAFFNMSAIEVVNFKSTGIIINYFKLWKTEDTSCKARVMSGPPNNSSKELLDLSTATIPYKFELQYFTVVAEKCGITISFTPV